MDNNEGFVADGFREFENFWTQKLEDRDAFERLSEEELSTIIKKVENNCFILELQNEVIEKYLQRHNMSLIREVDAFMKEIQNEDSKSSISKILTAMDESQSFNLQRHHEPPYVENNENAVIEKVIEIVNQEIADICMHSKIKKKAFNNEVLNLSCELESYKSQALLLENILKSMNEHIPNELKGRPADNNKKLQKMIRYIEDLTKRVVIDIRKSSLEVNYLKREYFQLCQDRSNDDKPIIPADLKLLQVELDKLTSGIAQQREVLLDLAHSLVLACDKVNSQDRASQALKFKIDKLNNILSRLNERHVAVQRYCKWLKTEVEYCESKKEEVQQLCSIKNVPSPMSYIRLKEKYSDILKQGDKFGKKIE